MPPVQVVPSPGCSGAVAGHPQEIENKIDLSHFPLDVQEALSAFDTDGDGIEVHELRAAADKWQKSKGNLASFDLSAFPEGLQSTLKSFDQDGDGTVNKTELAQAAKMYSDSKRNVRMLRKVVCVMSFVLLLTLVAIMGLVWMVVDMSKETKTADDGMMMVKGSTQPVQTARLNVQLPLGALPRMPSAFLENLDQLTVLDALGMPLIRKLQGIDRLSSTSIVIHTTMGDVISILSATEGAIKLHRTSPATPKPVQFNSSVSGKDSFNLCTACSHCAAVNVFLDDTTKPIVDKYWADVDTLWAAGGAPVKACMGKLERSTAGGGGRRLGMKYRRLTDDFQCAEEPDCSLAGYISVLQNAMGNIAIGLQQAMEKPLSQTSFCTGDNEVTAWALGTLIGAQDWGPYLISSMYYASIEFGMESEMCFMIHDLSFVDPDLWVKELCPYWEGEYLTRGYRGMMEMLAEKLTMMMVPGLGVAMISQMAELLAGLTRRLQEETKVQEGRKLMLGGSGISATCEGMPAPGNQDFAAEIVDFALNFIKYITGYVSADLSNAMLKMLNAGRCLLLTGFAGFMSDTFDMMAFINKAIGGPENAPQEFMNDMYPSLCSIREEMAGIEKIFEPTTSYDGPTSAGGDPFATCSITGGRRLALSEIASDDGMSDPTHTEYARQVVRQLVRR